MIFSHAPAKVAGPALARKPLPATGVTAAARLTVGPPSQVQIASAGLMIFLLFLLYSRAPEVIANYVGSQISIVRILSILMVLAVIFTRGLKPAFVSRVGIYLTAFTVWLMLSTPFSVWRGGSFQLLTRDWYKAYLFSLASIALLMTTRHCRTALYAIGLGTIFIALLSFVIGQEGTGRLQMETGSFQNPNDLAFFIVGGIPVCLLLAKAGSLPARIAGRIGVGLLFLVALKTGSRMGMIMLVALLLILFVRAPAMGKLKLMLVFAAAGVLALSLAPRGALDRYRTMIGEQPEVGEPVSEQTIMAEGSTTNRIELLKKSLELTFEHPLLGVGPGMFGVATSEDPDARQKRLAWRETHNTYTEISSECGIPALLFFVAPLVWGLRTTYSLAKSAQHRPELQPIAETANCLFLSLTVFAVGACFGNYAYSFYFPIFAGLTAAFQRCVKSEVGIEGPQTV